jgi:hypothetical protein
MWSLLQLAHQLLRLAIQQRDINMNPSSFTDTKAVW